MRQKELVRRLAAARRCCFCFCSCCSMYRAASSNVSSDMTPPADLAKMSPPAALWHADARPALCHCQTDHWFENHVRIHEKHDGRILVLGNWNYNNIGGTQTRNVVVLPLQRATHVVGIGGYTTTIHVRCNDRVLARVRRGLTYTSPAARTPNPR